MSLRKRSERILRLFIWGGLAAWVLALGVFYVVRTVRGAPGVGDRILDAGLMGRTVEGGEIPLLPPDSVVAVLAATAECVTCRLGVPAYREIASRLRNEGVAFRVVVGTDVAAARQYSRLLPEPGTVVADPGQKLFRSMGVRVVPTLFLVGRDGLLRRSWAPLPEGSGIGEIIVSEARRAR